jgi:hypothetical protein
MLLAVRRFGSHMRPTVLDLIFNEPLEPMSARNSGNYRIIAPEPVGGSSHRVDQGVRVDSETYNPGSFTVRLFPDRRLDIHYHFRLAVHRSAPQGVSDVLGRLLDGAGSGYPGRNQTTVVTWRNLVFGSPWRGAYPAPATSQHAFRLKYAVQADEVLAHLEYGSRSFRTEDMRIRPILHWLDERVRAHGSQCK